MRTAKEESSRHGSILKETSTSPQEGSEGFGGDEVSAETRKTIINCSAVAVTRIKGVRKDPLTRAE